MIMTFDLGFKVIQLGNTVKSHTWTPPHPPNIDIKVYDTPKY